MKWKLVRENAPSEPEMGSFAPMGSYSRKPVAAEPLWIPLQSGNPSMNHPKSMFQLSGFYYIAHPSVLVLSRQPLPTLDRTKFAPATGLHKGGYILSDASTNGTPDVILMATGSEVHLMLQAHDALAAEGTKVRSVSMPSIELFKQQSQDYIDSVLPNSCRARVSIEASRRDSWGSLIGLDGEHVGMIVFGASGPIKKVQTEKGFTVEAVVSAARRVMAGAPRTISSRAQVLLSWKKRKLSH
eukprot:s403_g4.t1